jgi:hypothetical protein
MDLSEAYEVYQGDVRCWGCRAVLEVTMQEGKLKAMRWSDNAGGERASAGRAESPKPRAPETAAGSATSANGVK